MKKCYVLFSLLMSTVVFTACGTGIKNSSGSSNSGSNSSVSMQTQNIEMEIMDLKKYLANRDIPMRLQRCIKYVND